MRQINFGLIFAFGLAMVFFTLENTAAARRPLTPADSKWWALLNAEFRQKKNCTSIVF